MTTQQIQYIIAITEEGSFSAAAKKLVVTRVFDTLFSP